MRWLKECVLACLLSLCSPLVHAAGADVEAFYEVCVNGVCSLPVLVLTEPSGRRWIDATAFEQLSVPHSAWASRDYSDSRLVDPLSIHPDGTLRIDEAALRVDLQLPGQAWTGTTYAWSRRTTRPQARPGRDVSGYLDYSVYGFSGVSPAAYGELGVVRGAGLLRSSFNLDRRGLRRGFSAIEVDDIDRRRRFVVGDQYLGGRDPFGATALVGGVGVSSAYELDPYLVRFPGADLRGVMSAPGTVDIYANGQLVARQQVAAGPFLIDDVLLSQGSNDLRIVVNDPFSGSYEVSSNYYASASSLAPGLHEYAYRAGRVRETGQARYRGGLILSAFHRYGFTDWLTAGVRHESRAGRTNTGLTADLRTPLGALALAWATSRDGSAVGTARRADYAYQANGFALGLGWQAQSDGYTELVDAWSIGPAGRRAGLGYVSASLALPARSSVAVRHQRTRYRGREDVLASSLRLSTRIGRDAQFQLEAGRRQWLSGSAERYFQVNFVQRLARGSASLGGTRSSLGDDNLVATYYQPRREFDRGTGFRGEIGRLDGRTHAYAEVDHARTQGHAQVSLRQRGEDTIYSARFAGSLLWAGGGLHPVQTGSTGYALVRTPGVPGVPVMREHQRIGVTDARGRLLVPNLLPYHANLIAIDERALEIDQSVADPARFVSVRRHGVALLEFDIRTPSALQARLTAPAGDRAELGLGRAWPEGRESEAIRIGPQGEIYIEGLPPGELRLRAVGPGGRTYRCVMSVPGGSGVTLLGDVECDAEPQV